ncbi:uncharacterized protein [Eurosta solidaginis]|uniref:uncharacterized protein n=1 Tax=Eurosta solidaginis TaxID=178769 RepID=UPI0035312D2F
MLEYCLYFTLIAPAVWGTLLPVAQSDFASHIVIVTPQAQVHLEPAIKYDAATFIHHLSPLARIAAPHEEAVVYVPSSAGAPIIPFEGLSVARANTKEKPQKVETKQWDEITQQIQQAIQTGSSQLGPQLSEAATAASNAAAAAGQGLFPSLFPPAGSSSSESTATSTANKEDKPKITYQLPANTEALLPSNSRIFALTPAVPHVVDFVHSPIYVGPIPAIQARSIQDINDQTPLISTPLSEQIPLKYDDKDFKELQRPLENKNEGFEKKSNSARNLETTTHKDNAKQILANKSEQKQEKVTEDQYLDSKNKLFGPSKEGLLQAKPSDFKITPTVDLNQEDEKKGFKKIIADSQPQAKVA